MIHFYWQHHYKYLEFQNLFNYQHWCHYHHQIGHHFWKFWQVRNLRLPFHYLPKFRRNLQVCSSDGLFVCLFVCNVNDTGRTVQAINTKLGTCMYLGSGYGCIVFGVHDVIDDVIRSKNRSNFEIAITPSIFELECRTKSQKIGNGMAYRGVGLNFRYNFRFKR